MYKLISLSFVLSVVQFLVINCCFSQTRASKIIDYFSDVKGGVIKVIDVSKEKTSGQFLEKGAGEILIEQNGRRFPLPKGVRYLGFAKGRLYTFKPDIDPENPEAVSIQANIRNADAYVVANSLKLNHFLYSFHPLEDNGNILVTDEWEGFGTEVLLYSPELKVLTRYSPFSDKGFEYSIMSLSSGKVAFVFFPKDREAKPKLVKMNTSNGDVELELDIETKNQKITAVQMVGDYTLISQHSTPDDQQLVCFDHKGNVRWKNNGYIYAMQGILDQTDWKAFVMDNERYWLIDLKNGKYSQPNSLRDLRIRGVIGKDIWIDLSANPGDNEVKLLVSREDVRPQKYIHDIFVIDPTNHARKKETIKSGDEVLSFRRLSNKLLLNNSNNELIKSYEANIK